jgi:hypothetical protein
MCGSRPVRRWRVVRPDEVTGVEVAVHRSGVEPTGREQPAGYVVGDVVEAEGGAAERQNSRSSPARALPWL